jgi:hypothetical protein
MENVSYHCNIVGKVRNIGSRKVDIKEWFRKNCNECVPTETMPELLLRIAPHESLEKTCELDQVANEMDHFVITVGYLLTIVIATH